MAEKLEKQTQLFFYTINGCYVVSICGTADAKIK